MLMYFYGPCIVFMGNSFHWGELGRKIKVLEQIVHDRESSDRKIILSPSSLPAIIS